MNMYTQVYMIGKPAEVPSLLRFEATMRVCGLHVDDVGEGTGPGFTEADENGNVTFEFGWASKYQTEGVLAVVRILSRRFPGTPVHFVEEWNGEEPGIDHRVYVGGELAATTTPDLVLPGDAFVIIEGGVVTNSPMVPVFDLDEVKVKTDRQELAQDLERAGYANALTAAQAIQRRLAELPREEH